MTLLRSARPAACLAAAITTAAFCAMGSAAELGANEFDRYVRQITDRELFSDSLPEFEEPPWMAKEESPPPAAPNPEDELKGTMSVSAGTLLRSEEHGEVADFSGNGGSGSEVRLGFGRPAGWCVSVALSQVTEDLYSSIDDTSSGVTRYMFGMEKSWRLSRSMRFATGGGIAWNLVDIDDEDSDRDIEGLGGYLELRVDFPLAGRVVVGLGGRLLKWQGQDGFGNIGDELSTTMAADLGFRF